MKIINPIWYEGTLLLPQIFQQQELLQQANSYSIMQCTRIMPWGVIRIDIDNDSLALKKLKLSDCAVSFQDGTWFDSRQMQFLPPARDLSQIPEDILETTVYLALPELNTVGSNLLENSSNAPLRFSKQFIAVTDLYGNQQTEIAEKRLNFSLKFSHENRQNFLAIPILRLIKTQSNIWQLDTQYVPPVFFIGSNTFLMEMLSRQIPLLLNKSQRLGSLRKERSQQSADFLVSDISLFWLLNLLNQSIPEMVLLQTHNNMAPEHYYMLLARLVGSLLSFSIESDIKDIPQYDPFNLSTTFIGLNEMLLELLDTVIPTVLVLIDLEKVGNTRWIGHLQDARLNEEADYYISVRASVPLYELQERFPRLCKIGAPDDVERI
ncbi:MAG: type VI secretion system baseplate subunit TssK, partial [Snodgrassella sp.]|nr:type VI secretion system baseplate subunit TssK [Snodgrassella sp.]